MNSKTTPSASGRIPKSLLPYAYGFVAILVAVSVLRCSEDGFDRELSGSGSIEVEEARVSPLIPGRIKEIHVREGDRVRKGDILATLMAEEMEANVQFNRSAVDASRRGVQQAEAVYENASREVERARDLQKAGVVSRRDLEKAETAFAVAQATLQAARDRQKQLEAGWSRARNQLKETVLVSPMDGIVLEKNFNPGEVVMPGSPVLTVGNLKEATLTIYLPGPNLASLRHGQKATVRVDGREETFPANVVHISQEAEFTPKNVQTRDARTRLVYGVKLAIENNDEILKPGMAADAFINPDESGENEKETKR